MFRRRVSEANTEAVAPDRGRPAGQADPGGSGGPATPATPATPASPGGPAAGPGPRDSAQPFNPPPAGLDVSMPHPARVWNYWLGGRDFFAADKAAGEEISREFPHLAQTARAERAFLVRAVRFLVGPARIRQFLDVGAGLPAGGNTHEIAQGIAPDAGIVYADNDPVVLLHAKAMLATPGLASTREGAVCYTDADLRDVAAVLAGAASTLDMSKPVALILLGILGHVDDYGAARSITSQLMSELPAGSYLVVADGVSVGSVAGSTADGAQRRYDGSARPRYGASAPAPYLLRRPDELASFFAGLDLIEPGVVSCPSWRPDGRGAEGAEGDEATAYCGVARKP